MERDIVNIGKSVVIKGELNGSEDLTIEGHVEGTIQLRDHVLTIGPNGKIKAQVFAKAVIVLGEVNGNVTASEKVDIRDNGSVDGDIISPRVAIAEGAHFRGSVDMQRKGGGGAAGEAGEAGGGRRSSRSRGAPARPPAAGAAARRRHPQQFAAGIRSTLDFARAIPNYLTLIRIPQTSRGPARSPRTAQRRHRLRLRVRRLASTIPSSPPRRSENS